MKKKVLVTILVLICIIGILILGYHIKRHNQNEEDPYGKEGWIKGERYDPLHINSKFVPYFGTNVSASQARNVLLEIKTHNTVTSHDGELYIIGVCYISNDANKEFYLSDSSKSPEEKGLYATTIDITNLNEETFNDYNFSSDVDEIRNNINNETTYTINVANNKKYKINNKMLSGFEKDGNPIGATQTGSTGGYYSSDSIRLIYIIEN